MYFARFDAPGGEIFQAALCLKTPCGSGEELSGLSNLLLSGLSGEGSSFSLRTQVAAGKTERLLLLNYPATARASLEALVRELTSLPRELAHLCVSRDQHDEIAADFPSTRQAWMRPGGYRAGKYLLASDFQLLSVMDPFFLAARDQGWRVGYQINVLRQAVHREDLRWLRKQLVRMELDGAFPEGLYDLQRVIVDRLPEATCLLDEIVGCGNEQAWEYLTRLVEEEFALQMKRYGFSESPLAEEPADLLQDSIATGFQLEIFQESEPVVRAAASASAERIEGILRWMTSSETPPRMVRRDTRQSPKMLVDVFISYSSPDRETALTVCRELEGRGFSCWIAPRDVWPGASYPEAIMQGLRAAKVLVLVFSDHACSSPHVEREVERAVSLRTPVLSLRLTDLLPTGSLEYLISASQWQDAEDPPRLEEMERLAEAVKKLVHGRV